MDFKINNSYDNFCNYNKKTISHYPGFKNLANRVIIHNMLARFDKDVGEMILSKTFLKIGPNLYALEYISEENKIETSLFEKSLICLADVLQKIKKEDPNLFSTLANLDKELTSSFTLYLYEKDWNSYESSKAAGTYLGDYYNNINLQSFNPSPAGYYHEIIHAIDDGKVINTTRRLGQDNTQYNINADYLSTNPRVSNLAKDIYNYRKKMAVEWKKDYVKFKEYWELRKEYECLKAEVDCGRADDEEKNKYDIIFTTVNKKENYLLAKKRWFDEIDFLQTCCQCKRDHALPPALKNNYELIAYAMEYLKYGTPEQKDMIKKDKELMDIIKRWKEFKPR